MINSVQQLPRHVKCFDYYTSLKQVEKYASWLSGIERRALSSMFGMSYLNNKGELCVYLWHTSWHYLPHIVGGTENVKAFKMTAFKDVRNWHGEKGGNSVAPISFSMATMLALKNAKANNAPASKAGTFSQYISLLLEELKRRNEIERMIEERKIRLTLSESSSIMNLEDLIEEIDE